MNTGGEAADQVIRMSLNGAEVALKISGTAAKEVANMLYALLKDNKKSKGRTRMENLVKTGKPLTIFTIKVDDYEQFKKEAKRYGILYCGVKNARGNDDIIDVMVKKEDATRVDRIVERFMFADVSQSAQIKTDIENIRETKKQKTEVELEQPEKSVNEKVMEKLFAKPLQKEDSASNPNVAKTTKSRPSEPILKQTEGVPIKLPKPSVRKELANIKVEQDKKSVESVKEVTAKNKSSKIMKHTQPKQKKVKRKER